jgi:hypothetical protein
VSEERFSVVVFDREGYWRYIDRDLPAEAAMLLARDTALLATDLNDIDRIMITDADDFAVFLWERGKGVVYPNKDAEPEAAGGGVTPPL